MAYPPESHRLRKILSGIGVLLVYFLMAVSGYVRAGWPLRDAVYMVVITVFGVGYGEVRPVDTVGLQVHTTLVIVAGYGVLIFFVGVLMQMLIDGEINKALGARRMSRDIERLTGHTIICGYGRMGTILARDLREASKPFVVIDSNPERLSAADEAGYLIIQGDATEEGILERAGIERCATVAAVLSEDAVNVFVTITARAMNETVQIIARGENPRTEKKLMGCGADRVVLPTAIGASKVAQLIIRPTAENMLEQLTASGGVKDELGHIGLKFGELEVKEGSPLVEEQLKNLEVKSNHGFLVVGVRHLDGTMQMNPDGELILTAGDVVVVLGHENDIPKLAERFSSKKQTMMYRGQTLDA